MLPRRCAPTEGAKIPRRHTDPTYRVSDVNQSSISHLSFEQCALCAKSSNLQASHIIPAFVFDWLRETSATGHFRLSENPNLRVQDGLKPRMLCWDCEQLFASWEKTFAERCFVPINCASVPSITYGPWMLKFATSISWRVLRSFVAAGYLSEFPSAARTQADLALDAWTRFLLGERPHPGRHEQHMILADVIDGSSISDLPPNINRYLARAIEPYVAYNENSVISYAKMGRFVLFGFVDVKYPRRWKGTRLHVRHGRFGQCDIELPSDAGDFIFERARLVARSFSRLSDRQHERIRKSYERDLDHAAQSETFRAMHHDILMFGDSAFAPAERTPSGSTMKDTD